MLERISRGTSGSSRPAEANSVHHERLAPDFYPMTKDVGDEATDSPAVPAADADVGLGVCFAQPDAHTNARLRPSSLS
jgi:hypothetical protein